MRKAKRFFIFSIVVISFFLAACRIEQIIGSLPPTSLPPTQPGVGGTPIIPINETGTPPPGENTAVLTASPGSPASAGTQISPTPGATPTPTPTTIPTQAATLAQPVGAVNMLILGSDKAPTADFHTDVMILMTLRSDGSVSLTSFPRDLYVYLPGKGMQRLNAAQSLGGFNLTAATFAYNFGVRLDYFMLTNILDFQMIIDTLGGVDVHVAQTYHDQREGYPDGYTVSAGLVHMDGATALWYSSVRRQADDPNRLRRSQEVLIAMGQKLFSLDGLGHATEFYRILEHDVVTDLTLGRTVSLVPRLLKINPDRITRYTIGDRQVTAWVDPVTHEYYLLPKADEIRALLQQAVGTP